ncbi:uncharacterized protein CTRU02_204218 [Colletotrichum truncatum]|uniref:Uncharacterized protein n=1 Tax=Colletotrichum truncatum TaxID=5467 RepID=A0ACC3ZBF0_COLTU|nr:uncharacterized protein CTRU02_10070 [Colletotrichum truncatum]KAF6787775.1 hypothetical protein CTRU02_10070 [Colletotrichum truncatum]
MYNSLRTTIASLRHTNHPDVLSVVQRKRRDIRHAVTHVSKSVHALSDMLAIHQEFDNACYHEAADRMRVWAIDIITDIRLRFSALQENDDLPPNTAEVK